MKKGGWDTYVEWGLAIDVPAVDVNFFVAQERDRIVHIPVVDGVEHYVLAHLFDFSNHFF